MPHHPLHYRNERNELMCVSYFDDFEGFNEFGALSNFYEGAPITIADIGNYSFRTGEHLFQAMKATNSKDFEWVQDAPNPGLAKAIGRGIELRPDWEEVKYDVMMMVLRAKFAVGREESDALIETGYALLLEGTHWNDTVWGVDLNVPMQANRMPPGRNWLGTMLMARRAELQAVLRFGIDVAHPTGIYNAYFSRSNNNGK